MVSLADKILQRVTGRGGDAGALRAARTVVKGAGFGDWSWYLDQYPDVREAGADPLDHYLRFGAAELRDPCESFSTGYYLRHNGDVAESGQNPLLHFCEHGWKEGRLPAPAFDIAGYVEARQQGRMSPEGAGAFAGRSPGSATDADRDYAAIAASGLFDAAFYLAAYPKVAAAGMDPIAHYIKYGVRERKKPSAWFDTGFYLKENPDVARSGANPFRHFCEYGCLELRSPSKDFDLARYWLLHMYPEAIDLNPVRHWMDGPSEARDSVLGKPSPVQVREALRKCEEVLERAGGDLGQIRRIAHIAAHYGGLAVAEKAHRLVRDQEWEVAEHHYRLAENLIAQKKWWLAAESLATATRIDGSHPNWFFRLGEANEEMRRYDQAAQGYRAALDLAPGKSRWHYRLGYVLEKAKRNDEAAMAYEEAIRLDPDPAPRRYGVGVYHQSRGYWDAAREAYRTRIEERPFDGGLHYRLGMAYDRLYRWAEAAQCYRDAIALDAGVRQPGWHYRLGFVRERMAQWGDAALAYAAALSLSDKHVPYWNYRLGYVLERMGRHTQACVAFLNTRPPGARHLTPEPGLVAAETSVLHAADLLPLDGDLLSVEEIQRHLQGFGKVEILRKSLAHDMTQPDAHYKLGESLERRSDWESAAAVYRAALERSSDRKSPWFYRLGYALYMLGRYEEACIAFRQTRVLQRPHGVSEELMKGSDEVRISTSYVEYAETLPVRENVILYESFNGNSLSCNPLAIFRSLLDHPVYGSYLHVWVLNDLERVPPKYRSLSNVAFVSKASDGYLRHLATAKYLINNSGFPPYFVRRPEQKYLATWHGTPLKTLGKEQKYKFYDHKRTQRNFLQATHIISPNKHTSDIQLDSYDIRPLYTGLFAETGYPRIDLTVNAGEEEKASIRGRMELSPDRPVVLYAPTWRGTLDEVEFDTSRLESDLAALSTLDCQVIFRGHSLLERVLGEHDVACQVVPADIDTNELLSVVDVLITDYSSVFFDFLATGRPVLYYIYDIEEYEQERGLYFSMDEMPGAKCRTIQRLRDELALALKGEGIDHSSHQAARSLYNYRDDGLATERVVNFLFDDSTECALEFCKEEKPTIVLNGGSFQPNGITTSFINLVNSIDRQASNVVVAFSPTAVEVSADCIWQFRKLPSDIYAVPRYGNMPVTLEERWIRRHRDNGTIRLGKEAEAILNRSYTREFIRVFGNKAYDSVVAFSGYDAFWTSVLVANDLSMRKAIYLHNDMYAEHVSKYPELSRMFDLYPYADSLVSVSHQTNALNRENLGGRLGVEMDRFVSCDNVINGTEILEAVRCGFQSEADAALFDGPGPVFINIGRLSVEKDQEKLIRAFEPIVRTNPSSRLVILGIGPLEGHLRQLVSRLGLKDSVHLLGFRRNPYPFLGAADCFVLSSNHEGQPMTLLESLVLRKPIVATDIVGNRSVMEGRGGCLVENTEAGLTAGMKAFASAALELESFDWRAYNDEAIRQFYQHTLGDMRPQSGKVVAASLAQMSASINFFYKATSSHYLEVQEQLNSLVMDELQDRHISFRQTGRRYVEGAVNFTWFIRQKADVLMSHGVADKKYYWMKDPENGDRYLDRFKAVCVPGRWMKDRIVRSKKLMFGEDQVHVVGWPRLDLLRRLQANVSVPETTDSIRLLWAPTHDNRKRGPEQQSTSTYPDFEPYAHMLTEKYAVEHALHPSNRQDKAPTVEKMLWSNVVVSDFGTMVYEAWALGKPVIFPLWILQDRVQKYLHGSTEAYIFENKIGYHPESYEEMLDVLEKGPVITQDVDAFMDEYLDNYRGGSSVRKLADVLVGYASK